MLVYHRVLEKSSEWLLIKLIPWPRSVLRRTMSWPASWMLPRENGLRPAKTPLDRDSGVVSEDVGDQPQKRRKSMEICSDGLGRKTDSAILNTEKTSKLKSTGHDWNRPVTLSGSVKRINQSSMLHHRAMIKVYQAYVGGFLRLCTHWEKKELSQRYPLAIKHGDGKFHTTLDSLDGFPIVFE